tara:strand:+ start:5575 stop:5721 length:147 start_codon:yes stop_codon:yes gene_type:complete
MNPDDAWKSDPKITRMMKVIFPVRKIPLSREEEMRQLFERIWHEKDSS